MSSLNRCLLIGRLGADPELRYTQTGQPVCNLRLATSESWKDAQGQRKERTEWHAVVVFGRQAETCAEHLAKGRQVFVEGRLESGTYTDREGTERRTWSVIASRVVFLGEGGRSRGNGSGGGGPTEPAASWPSGPRSASDDFDDAPLPF